jgi:hypothetical protein
MTIEKTNAVWRFEREIALADIRYDEEQRNFVHEYKEKCTLLALAGLSFAGFGAYLLIAGISDTHILKVLFGGGFIAIGGLTTLINMIARSDYDWKTR